MENELNELVDWLTTNRPKMKPYRMNEMKRHHRIAGRDGNSAYCFVAKEDFETKMLGKIKKGDLLAPASWSSPAKHARGLLFDKSTWESTFEEMGMRRLKG